MANYFSITLSIDYIEEQLKNLGEHQRHVMFELETMIDMAKDLPEKYLKSKSVRKKKLHSLLFSNIYINNEMQVTYRHKPGLDCIFSKKSEYLEGIGIDLNKLYAVVSSLKLSDIRPILLFQYNSNRDYYDRKYNFSNNARVLYGFDDMNIK